MVQWNGRSGVVSATAKFFMHVNKHLLLRCRRSLICCSRLAEAPRLLVWNLSIKLARNFVVECSSSVFLSKMGAGYLVSVRSSFLRLESCPFCFLKSRTLFVHAHLGVLLPLLSCKEYLLSPPQPLVVCLSYLFGADRRSLEW